MTAERMPTDVYLAFPVPDELRERTESVIRAIREDSTPRAHADELIEVVIELTNTGLESYFLVPVDRAGVGSVLQRATKLGVATAGKALPPLVRQVVGGLTDEQLREVAGVIDEMLIEVEAE